METKLKIKGNFSDLKAKLKQQNPSLTDTDLSYSAGQEDELVMRLSKKLNKSHDEIVDMIEDLQSKGHEREGREGGQREREGREKEKESGQKEKSKNY
jgi:uncharacterized protein YjbJ (UPF0337 family)